MKQLSLKLFLTLLFFRLLFSIGYAQQVTQRQIKFTSFNINNTYLSANPSGTIPIPSNAANKTISGIFATIMYEGPTTQDALSYTLEFEITGTSVYQNNVLLKVERVVVKQAVYIYKTEAVKPKA